MIDQNKVKNIFAFLSILFAEDATMIKKIMDFSPDYLIEKWERYVESERTEHHSGLHPLLRSGVFDNYCERWGLND